MLLEAGRGGPRFRLRERLLLGFTLVLVAAIALASDLTSLATFFGLLTAGALIGRPFIAPKAVPADRLAALRAAFDATMKDPEFLADADRQRLVVTPMTGPEVEREIRQLYQTPPDVVAAAKEISGE